jgi:hypothetical protein
MIYRTIGEYRQHATDRHQVFVRFSAEQTRLREAPGLVGQSSLNLDGIVGVESEWTRTWSTRAWTGASEAAPMGGVAVTRFYGNQREVTLQYQGNERAQDGLLLETLDGRQHRLTIFGSYLANYKWLFTSELYGREVHVEEHTLGYGVGGNYGIAHIFSHDKPNVRVGYRGLISSFSHGDAPLFLVDRFVLPGPGAGEGAEDDPRRSLRDSLVLDYLHRQGVYARYENRLSGPFALTYQSTVGTDYAVELGSFEYYWTGGFQIYPRKSIEIRLEGGYFSSSTTSGQASEQWQLIAGLKLWF